MKTINDILKPEDGTLGYWSLWANSVQAKLDMLRLTTRVPVYVDYQPVEYTSDNGHVWDCQHAHTHLEAVLVLPDDSEVVRVCDACDKQLIKGEWA